MREPAAPSTSPCEALRSAGSHGVAAAVVGAGVDSRLGVTAGADGVTSTVGDGVGTAVGAADGAAGEHARTVAANTVANASTAGRGATSRGEGRQDGLVMVSEG